MKSPDAEQSVVTRDCLARKHGEYNIVLANPPFGKKSSVTILRQHSRAAVVLPDNVLFFDRKPAFEEFASIAEDLKQKGSADDFSNTL